MIWQYTPYAIPLFLAAIFSGVLVVPAWRRRPAAGAAIFAVFAASSSVWCWAYALELLGAEYLTRLIRNGTDLGMILKALDHDRQQDLIDMLGWDHVESLCHDEMDLAQMLRSLPTDLGTRLLDGFEPEQLRAVVPDARALDRIRKLLEVEEEQRLEALLEVSTCAE